MDESRRAQKQLRVISLAKTLTNFCDKTIRSLRVVSFQLFILLPRGTSRNNYKNCPRFFRKVSPTNFHRSNQVDIRSKTLFLDAKVYTSLSFIFGGYDCFYFFRNGTVLRQNRSPEKSGKNISTYPQPMETTQVFPFKMAPLSRVNRVDF